MYLDGSTAPNRHVPKTLFTIATTTTTTLHVPTATHPDPATSQFSKPPPPAFTIAVGATVLFHFSGPAPQ